MNLSSPDGPGRLTYARSNHFNHSFPARIREPVVQLPRTYSSSSLSTRSHELSIAKAVLSASSNDATPPYLQTSQPSLEYLDQPSACVHNLRNDLPSQSQIQVRAPDDRLIRFPVGDAMLHRDNNTPLHMSPHSPASVATRVPENVTIPSFDVLKDFVSHRPDATGNDDADHLQEPTLILPNVTEEVVAHLDDMAQEGKLPGWNGAVRRYHFDNTLILRYPSSIHEIMPDVFARLRTSLPRRPGSKLRFGASTTVRLLAGSKDPDYSIYEVKDSDGTTETTTHSHPTVVFEVGFSQDLQSLREAACRVIGGSLGAVRLVVIIKLGYTKPQSRPQAHLRGGTTTAIAGACARKKVEHAVAEFWVPAGITSLPSWEGAANCVVDGPIDDSPQEDPEIVLKYTYVAKAKAKATDDSGAGAEGAGTTFKMVTIERDTVHNLFSEPSASLDFYPDHLFRGKIPKAQRSPALSIPYADIRAVIEEHEKMQVDIDNAWGTKRKIDEIEKELEDDLADLEEARVERRKRIRRGVSLHN